MPSPRKALLVGAAVTALAGVAGLAVAEIKNAHVLDVRLADGSLARIRYVGDTPPTVRIAAAPPELPGLTPPFGSLGPEWPFAALDQISQAIDRQTDAMLREANAGAGPFAGPDPTQLDAGKLPPGAQGFAMVSTLSGGGVCTRSLEYRAPGDGRPPQVVTRTSGACSADHKRPAPSAASGSTALAAPPHPAEWRPV
jgi:hypothetical protein